MSEGKQTQAGTRPGWHPGMPEPGEGGPLPGEAAPAVPRKAAGTGKPAAGERVQSQASAGAREATTKTENLDVILDIPVTLTLELGRARIPIRTLMQLNQGSVVELERMAGEPLDVLVNGMLVAHGEVVVVNERFGIRFTDVVSATERVQTLR